LHFQKESFIFMLVRVQFMFVVTEL
jgi:hypothetical protein